MTAARDDMREMIRSYPRGRLRAWLCVWGLLFCVTNCCEADELRDPAPMYQVTGQAGFETSASLALWVNDSGSIRVAGDSLVISYRTTDGASWEVEYHRTGVIGD